MKKSRWAYAKLTIEFNGFRLKPGDAYETANNIEICFVQRTGWFQRPKPIPLEELAEAYKTLCPGMEVMFPGVVDKIMQPEILTQLGFPVDQNGNVSYS